jgi:hypothetical protein
MSIVGMLTLGATNPYFWLEYPEMGKDDKLMSRTRYRLNGKEESQPNQG